MRASDAGVTSLKDVHEKGIELKVAGSKFYYTACSLLVILKNWRSTIHFQKSCRLKHISYKTCGEAGASGAALRVRASDAGVTSPNVFERQCRREVTTVGPCQGVCVGDY